MPPHLEVRKWTLADALYKPSSGRKGDRLRWKEPARQETLPSFFNSDIFFVAHSPSVASRQLPLGGSLWLQALGFMLHHYKNYPSEPDATASVFFILFNVKIDRHIALAAVGKAMIGYHTNRDGLEFARIGRIKLARLLVNA